MTTYLHMINKYICMSIDDLATGNSYYRDVSLSFIYLFKKSIKISNPNLTVGGSAPFLNKRKFTKIKSPIK